MEHSFDTDIAKKYGIECAVIYKNILFWISKNKETGRNFLDEKYWTYNSVQTFSEVMPYMSKHQIRYALEKLVKEKVLIKRNYNKKKYDRTNWYAFYEEPKRLKEIKCGRCKHQKNTIECEVEEKEEIKKTNSVCEISQIHETHIAKGYSQSAKPIPDDNTNINNLYSKNKKSEEIKIKKRVCFETQKIYAVCSDAETNGEAAKETAKDINTNSRNNEQTNKKNMLEFTDLKNEILRIYFKLTGRKITRLSSLFEFNTNEKITELYNAFVQRRYEMLDCVILAYQKTKNTDVNFRFRNFINALYAFLQNGADGARRYMSSDEKEKIKAERKKRREEEKDPAIIEEEMEKEKMINEGMNEEEYKKWYDEECERMYKEIRESLVYKKNTS